MNWLFLNEWKMLEYIYVKLTPNISIMPLISYTWNSKKYIKNYTKNEYIRNEMQRIMNSKLDE
jgi:hypothetical protein